MNAIITVDNRRPSAVLTWYTSGNYLPCTLTVYDLGSDEDPIAALTEALNRGHEGEPFKIVCDLGSHVFANETLTVRVAEVV